MKKFGFTLAEVLITMTIIGVVAALTTPALFHNAHNAQVGPKLAKIKSTIENANQQLMQQEEIGRLPTIWSDLNQANDIENRYIEMLSDHMRLEDNRGGTPVELNTYMGTQLNNFNILGNNVNNLSTKLKIGTVEGANIAFVYVNNNLSLFFVDINGTNVPNRLGKDIFCFMLNDGGMLTPFGDFDVNGANGAFAWQALCNPQNDPPVTNNAIDGLACTATIFANGLKVTYDD